MIGFWVGSASPILASIARRPHHAVERRRADRALPTDFVLHSAGTGESGRSFSRRSSRGIGPFRSIQPA